VQNKRNFSFVFKGFLPLKSPLLERSNKALKPHLQPFSKTDFFKANICFLKTLKSK